MLVVTFANFLVRQEDKYGNVEFFGDILVR